MKSHRFLEHTADVLLEAGGGSFEEAMEAAADGLFETIADTGKLGEVKEIKVSEEAGDLGSLVVFTLSDLLSEMEAEEVFLRRLKVEKFEKAGTGFIIEGTAYGSPQKREFGRTVVKAVTHHLLQVEEKNGKWKIQVLLDI